MSVSSFQYPALISATKCLKNKFKCVSVSSVWYCETIQTFSGTLASQTQSQRLSSCYVPSNAISQSRPITISNLIYCASAHCVNCYSYLLDLNCMQHLKYSYYMLLQNDARFAFAFNNFMPFQTRSPYTVSLPAYIIFVPFK